MDFEFDPVKSSRNAEKHGIDFETARFLWGDDKRLVVPARNSGEVRYAIIAEYDGKIWTCIYTHREDRIRIISTRRARHEEESHYHHG
ncbi:MAG: BrnT family toxin [Verrucomicrobiales bacterium]|jgi:uncharacterized DUF497 family protein|nr:BrnT family toxin [Verrucomicrobiales bacterium]